jgi:hypothetical protein
MLILLVIAEGKILAKLPRVPSGAQHRRRFIVMHLVRERDAAQFLLKIFIVESPSFGSIR